MAYGIIKIDTITFTDGGIDKSVSISGLVQNPTFTGNITVTGTVSGNTVRGQTISGVTITGTTAQFTSGTFVSLTGTTIQGTTATYTTGSFTSLTGTTTSGTTANFVSGVFSTQISGATVTGTTANFTSGNFTNISGGTHTITSGVFAAGTAANPSISFTSDPNTGIYSPGADQVAISTNSTGRLFVDASGNVGVGNSAPGSLLTVRSASSPTISVENNTSTGFGAVLFRNGGTNYGLQSRINLKALITDTATGASALTFETSTGDLAAPTERMRLDSSGRLGLGTSSPGKLLDINQATASAGVLRLSTQWTASSNAPLIEFERTGSAVAGQLRYSDVAGTMQVGTTTAHSFQLISSGSTALTVDSSQRVGIGTTGPTQRFQVTDGTLSNFYVAPGYNSGQGTTLAVGGGEYIEFATNGITNPRARITSDGKFLVGTSTGRSVYGSNAQVQLEGTTYPTTAFNLIANSNANSGTASYLQFARSRGTANGSNTIVQTGDRLGGIAWCGANGSNLDTPAATIEGLVDTGTPSATSMPGRLVFSVTSDGSASPTEACRINSSQQLLVNTNASVASFNPGRIEVVSRASELALVADATDTSAIGIGIRGNTSTTAISFFNASDGATCGTIVLNSGSTSYNTSSDYRLKENVVPLTGAADRVNQLQVHRFNFIADPDKTVDGFLAHEAQAVVPECVTGEKDAVDENGNPVYQGIDQSKLVPLLTAALQEALQKIEDLEGRLTAAGL